jgi:DNA-binding NarL/FixJ family response regulator
MGRVFLLAHHPDLREALSLIIQQQSGQTIQVIEGTCEEPDRLAALKQAQPDVIVLVMGTEVSRGLRFATSIRSHAPGCQVLVVDTLGEGSVWQAAGWDGADALLVSEQLETELVPTIRRLVAQRGATPSQPGGDERALPTQE